MSDPICAKHPKGRFPANGVRHFFPLIALVPPHWLKQPSEPPEFFCDVFLRRCRATSNILSSKGADGAGKCLFVVLINKISIMPIQMFMFRLTAATIIVGSIHGAGSVSAESWTDLRGTQTIEARMLGTWGETVVLELLNGKRVTVSLSSLRSESRIQAQTLQRELNQARAVSLKELESRAIAAAAPAPSPLPMPRTPATYKEPKSDLAVDEFLNEIDDQIRNGHVLAMYDALPPAYRTDINEIVKLAAEKVSADQWQATVGGLHQLGDLLVTRQRWLLSSPRVKELPTEQFDTVAGEVLTLAGLLRSGMTPELTDLSKLQSTPFDQWLTQFDTATAAHLSELFRQTESGSDRSITVDSQSDDTAVVSIDSGGLKSKVTYKNVDGYWVPKSLADKWTEIIAAIKSSINDGGADAMLNQVASTVTPLTAITAPMLSATTSDQFHGAMEPIFTTVETFAVAIGAMMGKKISLAGAPSSMYGSGSPYGDSSSSGSSSDGYNAADYTAQMEAEQRAREQAQIEASAAGAASARGN